MESRTTTTSCANILKRMGILFNWVALIALTTMLGLVVADIVGAKFFRHPVPGAMDIVSLLGAILIAFSATKTQILGRHIEVDFVAQKLPGCFQRVLELATALICSVFFYLVVWRCFLYGYDMQITGEVSQTQRIPLFPFAYAIALACMPVLLVFILKVLLALRNITKA